jgi:hypothetical protein
MERKLFFTAGIGWLTLALTALNHSRVWNRLPRRMAVQWRQSFTLHSMMGRLVKSESVLAGGGGYVRDVKHG